MAPKKPATAASSAPAARTTVESTSKVTKKRLPKKSSARPGERVFKDGAESQLEYDDNDSLEDIISEIGKRSLTNVDKELIEAILFLEDDDDEADGVDWERVQRGLDEREIANYVAGKPFNCHFKLYQRFIILKEDRINRANVARRSNGPGRSQSIEVPAQLSPRGSKSSTGSVARSSSKPASPKVASPNKAASPKKPASPGKAAPPRANSRSPTKATAPGKRLNPVVASAGGPRAASRSPTQTSRRAASVNPPKQQAPITRPIRGSASGSPKQPRDPKAESERRFNAKDDYGAIMRKMENFQYTAQTFGDESPEADEARIGKAEWDVVSYDDGYYAFNRGLARAMGEKALREEEQRQRELLEPEEIDEVDYNGIVLDQRLASGKKDRGKKKVITRPTPSPSPAKSNSARGTVALPRHSKPKTPVVEKPLPKDEPSKKGHGKIRSTLNPEYLTQDGKSKKKNAFFETMPLAEEWHRNMPSFLSIGETPYMETVVSNQIEDDLGRTHEEVQEKPPQKKPSLTGYVADTFSTIGNMLTGGGSSKAKEPVSPSKKDEVTREEHLIATMWDLPGLNGEAPLSNQKVPSPARSRSQGSGRGSRG